MNVIFYNIFHKGDIHNSRGVITHIMKTLGESNNYFYNHVNGPKLLADINQISYINHPLGSSELVFKINNDLFINTHVGCKDETGNRFCSFGCNTLGNINLLNCIYRKLQINIIENDEWNLVPEINYNYFLNENIKSFFNSNKNKNILICNGPVLSGQCPNFLFTEIIKNLAQKHKTYNFILTQQDTELYNIDNILFSSNIIGDVGDSDLNEIACISTLCDVIVGRASGPFMFAQTKITLDDTNKTFIAFNDTIKDSFFSTKGRSNKIWSDVYTYDNIFNTIDSKLLHSYT